MVHCTNLGTSYQIIWYIEPKRIGAYRNEPTPFVPNFRDLANRLPVSRFRTGAFRVTMILTISMLCLSCKDY